MLKMRIQIVYHLCLLFCTGNAMGVNLFNFLNRLVPKTQTSSCLLIFIMNQMKSTNICPLYNVYDGNSLNIQTFSMM